MNIIIDFLCKRSVKYYRALIKEKRSESSRDLRVQLSAKSALKKTHHNTFEMVAMRKREIVFFLIPTKLFFDSLFENNDNKKQRLLFFFSAHLDADTPESKVMITFKNELARKSKNVLLGFGFGYKFVLY